jgi:hypothetical protein
VKSAPRLGLPAALARSAEIGSQAVRLQARFASELPAAQAQIHGLFSDLGEVTARAKNAESIAVKLSSDKHVRDGVGTRVTLHDGSPAGVEAFLERAIGALREGRLQALSVSNFRAKDAGLPYLDDDQFARLAEAARTGNPEVWIRTNDHPKSLVPAGYTAVHLNVQFANGARGELQVRGRHVHELAELEHASYDLRRGKLAGGDIEAYPALDAAQRQRHLEYLSALYRHARLRESAGDRAAGAVPSLPSGLPQALALRP